MQFGCCSNTVYDAKIITLPLSYSNMNYTAISSTRNTSDAVCNRIEIKSTNSINLNRSGSTNVTGWYLTIGY